MKLSTFTSKERILIRRFSMIASYQLAAKHILEPILRNIDGFRPLDTEPSGIPKPPNHMHEILMGMSELDRARLVGSSCVATSNLGYALEQAFKLLRHCETDQDKKWQGSEGHSLPKLFKYLSQKTQNQLSEIYSGIQFHDFELEEAFSLRFDPETKSAKRSNDLYSKLKYWHDKKLLQGSRYKYFDADLDRSVVKILIPYRTVLFLDEVLTSVLAPKIRIDNGSLTFSYSAPTFRPDDMADLSGNDFSDTD